MGLFKDIKKRFAGADHVLRTKYGDFNLAMGKRPQEGQKTGSRAPTYHRRAHAKGHTGLEERVADGHQRGQPQPGGTL